MIQIQPPLPNTSNMSIPLEGGAPSRGEKFALSSYPAAAQLLCHTRLPKFVGGNWTSRRQKMEASLRGMRCHRDVTKIFDSFDLEAIVHD